MMSFVVYFVVIPLFLTILAYVWTIYPLMIICASAFKQANVGGAVGNFPSVSIVIPVVNGEAKISRKIDNCLRQKYRGRIEILIVSDGVDEALSRRLAEYKSDKVKLISLPTRSGKSAAQNFGLKHARMETVLFTDIDAELHKDAIELMQRKLNCPNVGCVGGRISFRSASFPQRVYWKYENRLRAAEARLGVLSSISGAAILFRRSQYIELDPDTGDDMVIPLDLELRFGLKTAFVDKTIVTDELSAFSSSVFHARRRITKRNLLVLWRRRRVFNFFSHPALAFSVISHKVLRWLSPIFLVGILISFLGMFDFLSQVVFVLSGGVLSVLLAPLRLFMVEICGLVFGMIDFLLGRKVTYY